MAVWPKVEYSSSPGLHVNKLIRKRQLSGCAKEQKNNNKKSDRKEKRFIKVDDCKSKVSKKMITRITHEFVIRMIRIKANACE